MFIKKKRPDAPSRHPHHKTNPKRGALGVGESVASLTRLLRLSGRGFGGWGGRPVWPSDATQTKAASAELNWILGLSVPTVGIELIHRQHPIGRPSPRFIIQRTRAAGSGERSSPECAISPSGYAADWINPVIATWIAA